MRILCTFPGRNGDLLWQLPLIRAISRRIDAPVDLRIAGEFVSIVPLLSQQPYLSEVFADANWALHPDQREAPRSVDDDQYDAILHLGYRGWPEPDLVRHVLETYNQWCVTVANRSERLGFITWEELDLQTPWITLPTRYPYQWNWIYGFSDVHFELKFGLVALLGGSPLRLRGGLSPIGLGNNPRWTTEAGNAETSWEESARFLQHSRVFLACNSGLHVLAVAVGTPVILVEPLEARWNPIFYPLGMDGPQVRVVKGTDGRPTFDARHVADALQEALR